MLALEKENKTLKIAYFTLSKSLKNDLKNTMSKINKKSKIEFHDLESYLKKTFNLKNPSLILIFLKTNIRKQIKIVTNKR